MRIKGVTYDTGFINGGVSTKEIFDEVQVAREMRIIRRDLNCNGVRITGGDADRLERAAWLAAREGLEVWYCPFTCNLNREELKDFLLDAATRAARILGQGYPVVFVTGSEVSLFTKGFFSDLDLNDRIDVLKDPARLREKVPEVRKRLRAFFAAVIPLIRKRFPGTITYAALPFEAVDWTLFDIIATDGAYRNASNASSYRDSIRRFACQGKPAAITEFGCATYAGAGDHPGYGLWNIEWEQGRPLRMNGRFVRSETEQANYITALLDIFQAENVDAAFVTSFASWHLPHRQDPLYDLDMASYAIVKVGSDQDTLTYPGMDWEPKESFRALAAWMPVNTSG